MSGLSRGEAYKILREIGYIQQAEKRKNKNTYSNRNVYSSPDDIGAVIFFIIIVDIIILLVF